jgi:hypothetical protein
MIRLTAALLGLASSGLQDIHKHNGGSYTEGAMTEIIHGGTNDTGALARERVREGDEKFMRIAVEEARLGESTPGGGEVGCVIVRDGEVLVAAHNEAELRHDPTAHAEIVALRRLGEKLQAIEFRGCTGANSCQHRNKTAAFPPVLLLAIGGDAVRTL